MAYVLSPSIAAGGMGTVHLAVASDRSTPVLALKRVHRHLRPDPSFVKMLAAEASLASCVRHENVVTTYGADTIDDEVVLVMEYVHGLTLQAVTQRCRGRRLPPRIAGAIVSGALRGLHAVHGMGIVHCDVSPQNILLGVDGKARIADFGIARAEHHADGAREIHCKLAYATPEQLTGAPLDRRTDVFAAAIVLWEALVGEPLFAVAGEWNIVGRVLAGDVTRPRHVVPSIPSGLDAVVMRGLAMDPRDRFASALDMAVAVDHVFAADPVTAGELGAWMQSFVRDDESLRQRAKWISELRRSAPPATLVSPAHRPAPSLAPLLGLYCFIFLGALGCGLLGVTALAHGDDETLGTQSSR